ncbi:MAG: hypothetical protein ACTIM4_13350 [Marinomonas sp.]
MNKALVVVESPFQIISLYDAVHVFGFLTEDITFIINKNTEVSDKNFYSIKETIDFLGFGSCDFFVLDLTSSKKGVIKNIFNIKNILMILRSNKYSYIFLGEYRSYLGKVISNNFSESNLCYLDDGNAMKLFPDFINKKIRSGKKEKFYCMLSKLFGLDWTERKDFICFSAYLASENIEGYKVILNDYSKIREKSIMEVNDKEGFLFIGSPLFEAGVLDEKTEWIYLERAFEYLSSILGVKKITYIPHRRERVSKLKKIESLYRVKMDSSLLPIELKISNYSCKNIFGFYSSCFESLSVIFQDVKIISCYIDDIDVIGPRKSFVRRQYSDYKKQERIYVVKSY